MAERIVRLVDIDFNTDQAVKEMARLSKSIEFVAAEQKRLKKEGRESSVEYQKNAVQLKALRTQYNTVSKAQQRFIAQQQQETGSIKQLRLELAGVSEQWAELSEEERRNTEVGIELSKEKLRLTEAIRAEEQATGDARRNVGNYSEGMQEAIRETGLMTKETNLLATAKKKLVNAVVLVRTAFSSLKAALISTGIGALVVALGSLIAYLQNTREGTLLLRKIMVGFQTTVGVLLDLLGQLGGVLIKAFQNPRQAVEDLGNSIQEFFINKFNQAIEIFGRFGSAFQKIFSGDIKQGFLELGEAATDAFLEFTPAGVIAKGIVEVGKTVVEEVQKAVDISNELVERQQRFVELEREIKVLNAERRRDAENFKKIADDTTKTFEDRLSNLRESNQLLESSIQDEVRLAQINLKNLQDQLTLATSFNEKEEARNAIVEARVELINKQRELEGVFLENQRKINELNAQEEARRQAEIDERLSKEEEYYSRLQDLRLKNQLMSIADAEERAIAELGVERDRQLKEAEQFEQNEALKAEIYEQYTLKRKEVEDGFAKARAEQTKAQAELDKRTRQGYVDNAKSALATTANLFNKETIAWKAIKIAEASISAIDSAQKAYASVVGIPVVGPALAPVAAGTALAAGLQNVTKIGAVNIPKAERGAMFEIGGRSHAQGGTKFYGEDGTVFEAERNELLAVVNKRSTGMLKQLSYLNQMGGGVPFGGLNTKFARGGIAFDGGASAREVTSQVAPTEVNEVYVSVQDINRVNAEVARVTPTI